MPRPWWWSVYPRDTPTLDSKILDLRLFTNCDFSIFRCRNERKHRHILKSKKQEEEKKRQKEKQEQREKRRREAEAMDSYDDWMKKKVGRKQLPLRNLRLLFDTGVTTISQFVNGQVQGNKIFFIWMLRLILYSVVTFWYALKRNLGCRRGVAMIIVISLSLEGKGRIPKDARRAKKKVRRRTWFSYTSPSMEPCCQNYTSGEIAQWQSCSCKWIKLTLSDLHIRLWQGFCFDSHKLEPTAGRPVFASWSFLWF